MAALGVGLQPIAPNWVPRLRGTEKEFSTLSCSSTHNITLQVLQRRTLGPTPPNASPGRSLSWLVKGTSIKSGGIKQNSFMDQSLLS